MGAELAGLRIAHDTNDECAHALAVIGADFDHRDEITSAFLDLAVAGRRIAVAQMHIGQVGFLWRGRKCWPLFPPRHGSIYLAGWFAAVCFLIALMPASTPA